MVTPWISVSKCQGVKQIHSKNHNMTNSQRPKPPVLGIQVGTKNPPVNIAIWNICTVHEKYKIELLMKEMDCLDIDILDFPEMHLNEDTSDCKHDSYTFIHSSHINNI